MAEEDVEEVENEAMKPSFPIGRVKKIIKLDREIKMLTSEAQILISCSAELFLQFLAERSAEVATGKKRRTVKLGDLRTAVKKHRPTSDFLLDELPLPSQPSDRATTSKGKEKLVNEKSEPVLPRNTRRIDSFFRKPEAGPSNCENELENGTSNCVNESENGTPVCVSNPENGAPVCVNHPENGAPDSVNHPENGTPNGVNHPENGTSICVQESDNGTSDCVKESENEAT